MFCHNCGKEQATGTKVCTSCGAALDADEAIEGPPLVWTLPDIVSQRPIDVRRMLIAIGAIVATVLVLMAAVTSGWYILLDRYEYSDGEVEEDYYLFGLFIMEEVWVTTWDGESEVDSYIEYYNEDYFWESGEDHARIGRNTGYAVWTTVALAVTILVLTTMQLFVDLGSRDGQVRNATLLLTVVSFGLLVGALAYFGAAFPRAVDRDVASWELEWDENRFGPGYILAMSACVMFILLAFELWRETHGAPTPGQGPKDAVSPPVPAQGQR